MYVCVCVCVIDMYINIYIYNASKQKLVGDRWWLAAHPEKKLV